MDVRKMAKLGQKAMRAKQSKAEKVFWPLQAGRPRQTSPGLLEGVVLARTMANRFFKSVEEAGLKDSTAWCHLICGKGGKQLGGLYPFSREDQDRQDVEMANAVLAEGTEPIGVVFFLKDLEKNNVLAYARLFDQRYVPLVKVFGWDMELQKLK